MGCIGGLTVVSNLGYQKADRPDLPSSHNPKVSQVPVLIATAHKTHEQTGEIMGLALEFKRSLEPGTGSPTNSPLFLCIKNLMPESLQIHFKECSLNHDR